MAVDRVRECKNPAFCKVTTNVGTHIEFIWELILLLLSLGFYVIDISTDLALGVQYLKLGYCFWGLFTILLCIFPLIICQSISLRWHQVDHSTVSALQIFLHLVLLGVIQRYVLLLKLTINLLSKKCNNQAKEYFLMLYNHYQNDMSLLRLFESFLESAPQLLLQLYIMHEIDSWHPWTVFCAAGSLISLAWGIASYTRTMRNAHEDKREITWVGFLLQAFWRTGTMMSRIFALLLCASVLHAWFILAITIHWLSMTLWIIKQKTDLCATRWEEYVYDSIVGVVYCFCFFNLKEGISRKRMLTFYLIIAFENALCLFLFFAFPGDNIYRYDWFPPTAAALIVSGTLIGHTSQLLYYRWFHPTGPIKISIAAILSTNKQVDGDRTRRSEPNSNSSSTTSKNDTAQYSLNTGTTTVYTDPPQNTCVSVEFNTEYENTKNETITSTVEKGILIFSKKAPVRSLSDSELMFNRRETSVVSSATSFHVVNRSSIYENL